MHKFLLELPTRFETERLYLRSYQPGDGRLYFAVSQRNRAHLAPYESQNVLMGITTEEEAEIVVRELAAEWVARAGFFLGAFDKRTDEWVAQVYVGPSSWELAEFELGYVVDKACEGQGYGTEMGCCGMSSSSGLVWIAAMPRSVQADLHNTTPHGSGGMKKKGQRCRRAGRGWCYPCRRRAHRAQAYSLEGSKLWTHLASWGGAIEWDKARKRGVGRARSCWHVC